jgi:SAM-dependent methyltransferase
LLGNTKVQNNQQRQWLMLRRIVDHFARWWSYQTGQTTHAQRVTGRDILASLYTPWGQDKPGAYYFHDPAHLKSAGAGEQLAVPPPHIRMGYSVNDDQIYLDGGGHSAEVIRTTLGECSIDLADCGVVMDWGCATGRVLRWFEAEASAGEYWGVDQDVISIAWNKENLSPPFHFLTCTAYPHLPFADGKFGLIYGLSVFTHLEHFVDLWLMEMHRILRQGGVAIFTIHDEHTVQFFIEHGRPGWIPAKLPLPEIANHEITIIHGTHWYETYTFFSTDYVQREWGRFFDVLAIRPHSDGYQSAVVLRKR